MNTNKFILISLSVLLVSLPISLAQTVQKCQNSNDFICNLSQRLCQSDNTKLGGTVSQYCPVTCGICTPDATSNVPLVCKDEYTSLCALFKNHCNLFSGSLDHPCKKTCSICQ